MNKELIHKFQEELFKQLDSKPSWGKDQVKELFIITLNNVLLGIVDSN